MSSEAFFTAAIAQVNNTSNRIRRIQSLHGGCINQAALVETKTDRYFIKWNANQPQSFFDVEAEGLRLLRSTGTVQTPEVVLVGTALSTPFLILDYIPATQPKKNLWQKSGHQLASLHQCTASQYGLDYNNYIGALPQSNKRHARWIDFFIHERLYPQLKSGVESGKLEISDVRRFELLMGKLERFLPEERPALVHGDLWSGNIHFGADHCTYLIDPAVHYGHREAEIAFTTLFGRFDEAFYDAYHEANPLTAGFHERIDLYNLYPLLVHVNLFGGSYLRSILTILKRHG